MNEDNISRMRQAYAAYQRRDFPAIFAFLHPEIEIYQSELLPWGGTYRGQAEAREYFRKLSEYIESEVAPGDFIDAGDHIAMTGRTRGQVRSNGQAFEVSIVHLWTFKDGLGVRFEAYIDTPEMLRALDLQANPAGD
jgi:ketosteroid isomerase-like protein